MSVAVLCACGWYHRRPETAGAMCTSAIPASETARQPTNTNSSGTPVGNNDNLGVRPALLTRAPAHKPRKPATHAERMRKPGYRWLQFEKQARQRGVPLRLSRAAHAALIQQACLYCATPPSSHQRIGIDRINSALPYEAGNCVPCCASCNYMKNDQPLRTFLRRAKRIAKRRAIIKSAVSAPTEGRAAEVDPVADSDC